MYRKIENQIYLVTFYGCCNKQYIECENIEGLFHYVASQVAKGDIFFSAKEINKDGSTPKIKVLTDKKYKEIAKLYPVIRR